MLNKISYYIWSSNHRKNLDFFQEKYSNLYKGVVLDIGERDRRLAEQEFSIEKVVASHIRIYQELLSEA
jgi:hypothetical protein